MQGLERVVRPPGIGGPVSVRRKLLKLVALLQRSPDLLHLLKTTVSELDSRSYVSGRLGN